MTHVTPTRARRDIRSAGDAEDSTAAGSELTQGDAMAGSLAKSLRGKRRDGTGAPWSQRQGTEIGDLGHEGLLEQLRQFKISLVGRSAVRTGRCGPGAQQQI